MFLWEERGRCQNTCLITMVHMLVQPATVQPVVVSLDDSSRPGLGLHKYHSADKDTFSFKRINKFRTWPTRIRQCCLSAVDLISFLKKIYFLSLKSRNDELFFIILINIIQIMALCPFNSSIINMNTYKPIHFTWMLVSNLIILIFI